MRRSQSPPAPLPGISSSRRKERSPLPLRGTRKASCVRPPRASPGTGGRRRAARLYPSALPGAVDDRSAANAHRARMRAKQGQPAARAAGASSAAAGLNGMTVRDASIAPRIPRRPQRSIFITTLFAMQCKNNFPPAKRPLITSACQSRRSRASANRCRAGADDQSSDLDPRSFPSIARSIQRCGPPRKAW